MSRPQRRLHRKKLGPHPETQRDNYAEVRRAVEKLHAKVAAALADDDVHCGELHLVFVFEDGQIKGHKFVTEGVVLAAACRNPPLAFDAPRP